MLPVSVHCAEDILSKGKQVMAKTLNCASRTKFQSSVEKASTARLAFKCISALIVCMTAMFCLSTSAAAASPGYHLLKTYKVGGEGGWDYLLMDPASRHLYISRGTHVIVLDADSGKTVGDIPDTPGVHGIALAPELGRGFTSNGREGTVSIFDLKSLKVLDKVKVGENPDAIVYDPATKRVFTMNGRSGDASAIDAASGKVVGTIPLNGKPEFAVTDEHGKLFVNLEDKSELLEVDPAKLSVTAQWPLAPCESPSGLAIDRKHHRLFSVCRNQMMAVVDANSGKVIATPVIGNGPDAARFDASAGLAFASCGEGVLTIVHEDSPEKFSVVQNVTTQRGARTMALDSKTHNIFLVTAQFGPAAAPTPGMPRSRPTIVPDSFVVLVVGR